MSFCWQILRVICFNLLTIDFQVFEGFVVSPWSPAEHNEAPEDGRHPQKLMCLGSGSCQAMLGVAKATRGHSWFLVVIFCGYPCT